MRSWDPADVAFGERIPLLLADLAQAYARRRIWLHGSAVVPIRNPAEVWFAGFAADVARGAPEIRDPRAARRLVDQALGKVLLQNPLKSELFLDSAHATQLLQDFGKAFHPERFFETEGRTCDEWLEHVVALPEPPAGEPTPGDRALRAQVDAIEPAERASLDELKVWDGGALRDLSPLVELPGLKTLSIFMTDLLEDLGPLAALKSLERLELLGGVATDLSPIASLPRLRHLNLKSDRLEDLGPLAGLGGLEELVLVPGDRASDLSPLAVLSSLRLLKLFTRGVRDVSPVSRLTGLCELSISYAPIEDLEALKPLESLAQLALFECRKLAGVGPLAALEALEVIELAHMDVPDVAPLLALPCLRALKMSGVPLARLPSLARLPRLEELDLKLTDLVSLAGIESAPGLKRLTVWVSSMRDITPVASLGKLEELTLNNFESLSHLSPVSGLRGLRRLEIDGSPVRDLSPLSGLAALEKLLLPRTRIQNIEPIAGLPRLELLNLEQCYELRSIAPLARCASLRELDTQECSALKGPKTLEQLRAPPRPPETRYPSAGVASPRSGQVTIFDARNHLPRTPPEGWTIPELLAGHEEDEHPQYVLGAEEGVRLGVRLVSRDGQRLLVVQMGGRDPVPEKRVGRILRRFRQCEPFVETQNELLATVESEGDRGIRAFLAKVHPASPDSWPAVTRTPPLLRVEPADEDDAGARTSTADLANHLPSPLPPGWEELVAPKSLSDLGARFFSTPSGELIARLRRADGSDVEELAVTLPPHRPTRRRLGDEMAKALLMPFRRRGVFEEAPGSIEERAAGLRLWVARTR